MSGFQGPFKKIKLPSSPPQVCKLRGVLFGSRTRAGHYTVQKFAQRPGENAATRRNSKVASFRKIRKGYPEMGKTPPNRSKRDRIDPLLPKSAKTAKNRDIPVLYEKAPPTGTNTGPSIRKAQLFVEKPKKRAKRPSAGRPAPPPPGALIEFAGPGARRPHPPAH